LRNGRDAANGFNIMPPWLTGGCDAFIDEFVPILPGSGVFREDYEVACRETIAACHARHRRRRDRRNHLNEYRDLCEP